MVALATSCLSRSSPKYHHLQDYLEQPLKIIAAQQQPDGSFEHNTPTTALAIQALKIPDQMEQPTFKPISLPTWRPDGAVDWLRSQQKSDGSFGDLFTTSEVLLALASQSGYGFLYNQCSMLTNQTTAQNNSTTTESIPTTTTIASAGPLGGDPNSMIHFTYIVCTVRWICFFRNWLIFSIWFQRFGSVKIDRKWMLFSCPFLSTVHFTKPWKLQPKPILVLNSRPLFGLMDITSTLLVAIGISILDSISGSYFVFHLCPILPVHHL